MYMLEDFNDMLIIEGKEEGHINRLIQIAEESQKVSPKKSLELGLDALELSKKLGYQKGICMSLFRIGKSYWMLGEIENSSHHLLEALDLARRMEFKRVEAQALNGLGNVYSDLGNFDRSLEHYMSALKIAIQEGYKDLESTINNNVGAIYLDLKEMDPAIDYFFKSLAIAEADGVDFEMTTPLYNIGEAYYKQEQYQVSLEYLEKTKMICLRSNDNYILASTLQMSGKCYHKLGDIEKALTHMEEAKAIAEEHGMVTIEVGVLINMVKIFLEQKNHKGITACLSRAMQICDNARNWLLTAKVALLYVRYFEGENDYENALHYYKKYYEAEKISEMDRSEQRLRNITAQFRMEQANNEKELFRIKNIELKSKSAELERKSNELELLNNRIRAISLIGQDITSSLDLYQVLDKVYKHINELVDAYSFGIGLYDDFTNEISFASYLENGKNLSGMPVISGRSESSLAAWCVRNNKIAVIGDYKHDYPRYVNKPHVISTDAANMNSVIYHPLVVGNHVIGVLTIQSPAYNAYNAQDVTTITMLASYIAIAVNNATKSSKLENEIIMRKEAQQELEDLSQRLLNLSQLDGLTGVSNRRRFDEYFEVEWKRAYREHTSISMMFIDVDFFKQYNDNYGHISGDSCLIRVANTLRNTLKRSTDLIARFGGDEFVVLLCNTDTEGAMLVANGMCKAVRDMGIPHLHSEVAEVITISIGIATMAPKSSDDATTFTKTADRALYSAKQKGRACIDLVEIK